MRGRLFLGLAARRGIRKSDEEAAFRRNEDRTSRALPYDLPKD